MSNPAKTGGGGGGGGGFLSALTSGFSNFGFAVHSKVNSLLGYEGLEVVNPEGGQDDVEEEAIKGRFKQEVRFSPSLLEARDWYYSGIFSGTFLSEICCSRTAVYWHGARSSICKKTGDFHFKISRVCANLIDNRMKPIPKILRYLFIEPEIKFYVSLFSRQTS
jgi:hypothetical protein